MARAGIAQDEYCQAVHRKTPDHSKGVEVRKESNVTVADDDGDDLQAHDSIDDSIACSEALVRLSEPFAKHAVFRNAIQYAV